MNTLQKSVQKALTDDLRTREAAIEILNENGVITLSGIVPHIKTSEAAESIVKEVDGVVSVVNEIQVRKDDNDGGAFDFTGTLDENIIVK